MAGRTNRVSSVEVTRLPITTVAAKGTLRKMRARRGR
jgi:hypothetical protein